MNDFAPSTSLLVRLERDADSIFAKVMKRTRVSPNDRDTLAAELERIVRREVNKATRTSD